MKQCNGRTAHGRPAWATLLKVATTGGLAACVPATDDTVETATHTSALSPFTLTVNVNELHQTIDGLGLLEAVSLGVTDPLDHLWHQRGRSCPGVQHESYFRRSRGSGDLRLDDDQLAFTSEGARESRHR
jgi:hypothetical protein